MLWWTIRKLKSSNAEKRRKAVDKLGGSGSPRAVEPLVAVALGDEDLTVRHAAAKALAELGDARAVELLVAALDSGERPVREAAAQALGRVGDVRAVGPLVGALEDESEAVRERTAGALVKIGYAAVGRLIDTLSHGDADVRRRAAWALGKIGDQRASEALVPALRDPHSEVRAAAAKALESLGWQPTNDSERAFLAVAAGRWKEAGSLGVAAVEPLAAALKAREPAIRRGALVALARIGEPRAVEVLVAALSDENRILREEAAETLDSLGWKPADDSERALHAVARGHWDEAGRIGRPAVEPLLVALKDKEGRTRQGAASALGRIGDPRATEALIEVLADKNAAVRRTAVEALGRIGGVTAVEPLVAELKDEDTTVRDATVMALARVGIPAIESLIEMLNDKDWLVQVSAATALGEIGDSRALKPLMRALKDGRSEVRRAAAEALGKTGSARAIEALVGAMKDESRSVRQAALLALGEIGDVRALRPLLEHTSDQTTGLATITALTNLLRTSAQGVRTDYLKRLVTLEGVSQLAYDAAGTADKHSLVAGRYEVDSSKLRRLAWQELLRRDPAVSQSMSAPSPSETTAVICKCGMGHRIKAGAAHARTTCPRCGNPMTVLAPQV